MTIRLLDPQLHEFLTEDDLEQIVGELTKYAGMTKDEFPVNSFFLVMFIYRRGLGSCHTSHSLDFTAFGYAPITKPNAPLRWGMV